jgi:hypothetical protein
MAFSFQNKTPVAHMSNSIDGSIQLDWSIVLLMGLLLCGAVFIMFKLTVGSCYQPPLAVDRRQKRKET